MWYAMVLGALATFFGSFILADSSVLFSVLFALGFVNLFGIAMIVRDLADVALHNRFNQNDTRDYEPEAVQMLVAQSATSALVCAITWTMGVGDDRSLLFGVAAGGVAFIAVIVGWLVGEAVRRHYTRG